MDIEAVKSSYARWAPIYDRTFGAATHAGRQRVVDYINRCGGPEVLEVGVGTGLALPHYRAGLRVTGIDYSDEMLQKARKKVRERRLDPVTALLQMDARSLDFPDNRFDTVAAMHIVSVVPEPERVIAEMARVCKPGGRIVISNHFAEESGFLGLISKLSAPLANIIGWHSDFELATILGEPSLRVIEQETLPPLGMMTFLVMEKSKAEAVAAGKDVPLAETT
ncbi:class I SAM-dependent methyltransferase [Tropicibacter sp. S64]|uniref:class I SAM-dependent methyltransferase n=1 Tax=Tropicibacter sp. S64 TaxID=3415122 RepID=UPI003C7E1C4C